MFSFNNRDRGQSKSAPGPAPDEQVDHRHRGGEADGQGHRGAGGLHDVGGLPAEQDADAEQHRRAHDAGHADPAHEAPIRDAGQPGGQIRGHRGQIHGLGAGHDLRQVVGDGRGQPYPSLVGKAEPAKQATHPRPAAEAAEQVESAVRGDIGEHDDQQDRPERGDARTHQRPGQHRRGRPLGHHERSQQGVRVVRHRGPQRLRHIHGGDYGYGVTRRASPRGFARPLPQDDVRRRHP